MARRRETRAPCEFKLVRVVEVEVEVDAWRWRWKDKDAMVTEAASREGMKPYGPGAVYMHKYFSSTSNW